MKAGTNQSSKFILRVYDLSNKAGDPAPLRVKVLPGLSPIRQALIARRAMPEQELHAWEKISLQRIRIGTDAAAPIVEPSSDVDSATQSMWRWSGMRRKRSPVSEAFIAQAFPSLMPAAPTRPSH
jgi:hypothetical protein